MTQNEVKLSLKIMVDSKTKKVVFAEAGKDFVDFIFHILSLPLATVVKLLNKEDMPGCLAGLYKSIESLKTEYLEQNVNKDTILQPKLPINVPLLPINHTPATIKLFKCEVHDHLSDETGAICGQIRYTTVACGRTMSEVTFTWEYGSKVAGFVKEAVPYVVKDNLEVMPMSASLIMSIVKGFDSLVEQEVQFGLKEGLALLKASLETVDVLTTVFIRTKKENS